MEVLFRQEQFETATTAGTPDSLHVVAALAEAQQKADAIDRRAAPGVRQ
ncbi:hypothetical protein OG730_38150 [Streptomyces sp. NBC_01298]|nr:hypothetical protein OG730_38150 [Streptomyces sp. NBC_01298]